MGTAGPGCGCGGDALTQVGSNSFVSLTLSFNKALRGTKIGISIFDIVSSPCQCRIEQTFRHAALADQCGRKNALGSRRRVGRGLFASASPSAELRRKETCAVERLPRSLYFSLDGKESNFVEGISLARRASAIPTFVIVICDRRRRGHMVPPPAAVSTEGLCC